MTNPKNKPPIATPSPSDTIRLGRTQVAKKLDTSTRSVGRMHGKELHPTFENGQYFYSLAEVEAVAAARRQANEAAPETDEVRPNHDGQLASRVLHAFTTGKTPTQVVIEHSLPPGVVKQLHLAWMDLENFFVIRGPDLARFRKLLPQTKTAADLNADLKMLTDAYHELKRFVYPCCVCGKPIQAEAARVWADLLQGGTLDRWGHSECIQRQDRQG